MAPAKLVFLTYRASAFNLGGHRVTFRVHERLATYPLLPPPEGLISFLGASALRAQAFALAAPLGLLREGPDRFIVIANSEIFALLTRLPEGLPALTIPALVYSLPPELLTEVIRAAGLYTKIYPAGRQEQIAQWPDIPRLMMELGLKNNAFARILGLPENLFYYYYRKRGNQLSTTVRRGRKKRPRSAKRRVTVRSDPQRIRGNGRDHVGIGQISLPFIASDGAGR